MFLLADPIVDWSAMWKICLVALGAGAGVVVMFGFVLLGLKFAQGSPTHGIQEAGTDGTQHAVAQSTPTASARLGGFVLSVLCGLICVGVVAVGIYAMTHKPS